MTLICIDTIAHILWLTAKKVIVPRNELLSSGKKVTLTALTLPLSVIWQAPAPEIHITLNQLPARAKPKIQPHTQKVLLVKTQ